MGTEQEQEKQVKNQNQFLHSCPLRVFTTIQQRSDTPLLGLLAGQFACESTTLAFRNTENHSLLSDRECGLWNFVVYEAKAGQVQRPIKV
ncbi:uncharacterized protein PHALS_02503 [Plasmopara halstedii]|uniref:Uncharacterized protein n=1 Tax=Plasmopara halstedii TaxID=4781 RepID=A0A0N7L3N9_PLAHL|nr:uncharacterized protein PHALS_02503 [Plasmopara halstedii]CEG36403.1 hypothetical protein PHALS_02503 [Plasmopara halstedii]|eukprot:XP_024572772.1 hypothetical protein PHALS_02503 [Plasmopara halstedii]